MLKMMNDEMRKEEILQSGLFQKDRKNSEDDG